jgi:peptidoglycan biosynthesis protein MviN/MurJ (putative lipid II flippase)
LNFIFLYAAMMKYAGDIGTGRLLIAFFKIGLATVVMAAVCYYGSQMFLNDLSGMLFWKKTLGVFGLIGVAGSVYLMAAMLLKVEEIRDVVAMVRKRLGN